jgi:exodeoxyribonuclease VII small subunit
MANKQNSKLSFEEAMKQLEKIVDDLESGELTLDESVKGFERGITLSRICQKKLEAVENRVKKLIEKADGECDLELFGEEDTSDE